MRLALVLVALALVVASVLGQATNGANSGGLRGVRSITPSQLEEEHDEELTNNQYHRRLSDVAPDDGGGGGGCNKKLPTYKTCMNQKNNAGGGGGGPTTSQDSVDPTPIKVSGSLDDSTPMTKLDRLRKEKKELERKRKNQRTNGDEYGVLDTDMKLDRLIARNGGPRVRRPRNQRRHNNGNRQNNRQNPNWGTNNYLHPYAPANRVGKNDKPFTTGMNFLQRQQHRQRKREKNKLRTKLSKTNKKLMKLDQEVEELTEELKVDNDPDKQYKLDQLRMKQKTAERQMRSLERQQKEVFDKEASVSQALIAKRERKKREDREKREDRKRRQKGAAQFRRQGYKAKGIHTGWNGKGVKTKDGEDIGDRGMADAEFQREQKGNAGKIDAYHAQDIFH